MCDRRKASGVAGDLTLLRSLPRTPLRLALPGNYPDRGAPMVPECVGYGMNVGFPLDQSVHVVVFDQGFRSPATRRPRSLSSPTPEGTVTSGGRYFGLVTCGSCFPVRLQGERYGVAARMANAYPARYAPQGLDHGVNGQVRG